MSSSLPIGYYKYLEGTIVAYKEPGSKVRRLGVVALIFMRENGNCLYGVQDLDGEIELYFEKRLSTRFTSIEKLQIEVYRSKLVVSKTWM